MRYIVIAVAALLCPASVNAQAGPVGGPGRYIIVHSPHVQRDTILLDTATGKAWLKVHDDTLEGDPSFWSPMARIDNPAEAAEMLRNHPELPSSAK